MYVHKIVQVLIRLYKFIQKAKCFFQTSDHLKKYIPLVGERVSFDVNDLATVKISFLIIKLIIYSSQ